MSAALTVLRRVALMELRLYRSLYLWITRRPAVPPDGVGVPYVGAILVLLWAFVGVSAVEMVVLHLVIPWGTVRLVVDIASLWGLVWMLGLTAAFHVYPHVVGGDGLRVRNGVGFDQLIPWSQVASVSSRTRSRDKSRAVQVDDPGGGRPVVLAVVVGSQTNVDVQLVQPLFVPDHRVDRDVHVVRLLADDPRAVVKRARERLGTLDP